MARLSAAIMAHPVRETSAHAVQSALDRPVPIVWDENPVPSRNPEQRWATGRRAWETYDPAAEWHLVIQDDVLVCRDLLAGLEAALDQLPGEGLVSAYTGTGRPHQANVRRALQVATEQGHSWMSTRSLNWGPAIVLPTKSIPTMLEWCSRPQWRRAKVSNYDYRIGVWGRDQARWRTWYTVPSLVDTGSEPSLIGHDRGPERLAHRFLGRDASALDVDWSAGGPLTPGLTDPTQLK